jgi:hypothetical protein
MQRKGERKMKRLLSMMILALSTAVLLAACTGSTGPEGLAGQNGVPGPTIPVAAPGQNQYVLPGALVWLDGSGSYGPNGSALTYAWSFVSNPSATATFSSPAVVNPDFYADTLGQYVIGLTVNDGVSSSATATVTVTARVPVPDTGQTAGYTATFGEDSDYAIHPLSYTDNGDGTIRDNVTGLIWQKCTFGQNNDSTCSGTASTVNWYVASGTYDATYNPGAMNLCGSSTLAGGGWRLPAEYELGTIADFGTSGPAINSAYFPNTQPGTYWSSTTYALNTNFARSGDFHYGGAGFSTKTFTTVYVRCVRGQADPAGFIDNGNGTVSDVTTNLMWQQCSSGLSGAGCTAGSAATYVWDGASGAIAYCEALSLGGYTDWRLPKVKELQSIVDATIASGATINTAAFPNTQTSRYWSSTTFSPSTTNALLVNFSDGSTSNDFKTNGYVVRCVRGGQ